MFIGSFNAVIVTHAAATALRQRKEGLGDATPDRLLFQVVKLCSES